LRTVEKKVWRKMYGPAVVLDTATGSWLRRYKGTA